MDLFNKIINQPSLLFWTTTGIAFIVLTLILLHKITSDSFVMPFIRSQDQLETMGIASGACGLLLSLLAVLLKYYVGLIPGVGFVIVGAALIRELFRNMNKFDEELQNSKRLARQQAASINDILKDVDAEPQVTPKDDDDPFILEPGTPSFSPIPVIKDADSESKRGPRRISSYSLLPVKPDDKKLDNPGSKAPPPKSMNAESGTRARVDGPDVVDESVDASVGKKVVQH